MRPQRQLFLLAAVLGAVVIALPAVAGSEAGPPPSVNAVEEPASEPYPGYKYPASYRFSPLETASRAARGDVHQPLTARSSTAIIWQSGPETPTCSGGVPVELEEGKGATSWSGTCTFSRPGTYTFYCSIHGPSMHGTIVVGAGATTISTQAPSIRRLAHRRVEPERISGGRSERPGRILGLAAGGRRGGGGQARGQASAARRCAARSACPRPAPAGELEVDLLAGGASLGEARPPAAGAGRPARALLAARRHASRSRFL